MTSIPGKTLPDVGPLKRPSKQKRSLLKDERKRRSAGAPAARTDHRVRNGAVRRERTRRRLLAAALSVFAEKGPDAPSIDDVVAAAGVARGTFYNHFRTTQELLAAVTAELNDEVLTIIDKRVLAFADPVERVACGCLMYTSLAVDNHAWGEFITRVGLRGAAAGKLIETNLPRDLDLARKAGKAKFPTLLAAQDLILGCLMGSLPSVLTGKAPREHLRQTLEMAFCGIGVAPDVAHRVCRMPLPEIPLPADLGFSLLVQPRMRNRPAG
jgi:AcrR family transcriptional regulator